MVFDEVLSRCILYGGGTFDTNTYKWDGASWEIAGAGAPNANWMPAMTYDSSRGQSLLFGGVANNELDETWVFGSSAQATPYGSGCGQPLLAMAPGHLSLPIIGRSASVGLSGIPGAIAFMALGWSRAMMGPFPLPMALAGFGMPGCDLLQSSEVAALPLIGAGQQMTYSLAIPAWSGLIGQTLFLQGWAPAPGANSGGTITSNAIEWRIGSL